MGDPLACRGHKHSPTLGKTVCEDCGRFIPDEVRDAPWWMRSVVRWSERSLEPPAYWRDRYEDVLHERVDGFLSGVIAGVLLSSVLVLLVGLGAVLGAAL